jgi:hypothetical protein
MNNCEKLVNLIENNSVTIENFLSIYHAGGPTKTRYTWEFKLAYLKKIKNDTLEKEEIWTYLISCAYAYSGKEGIQKLTSLLCEIPLSQIPDSSEKIYVEYTPKTPRQGIRGCEVRNSYIDLALGCVELDKKHTIHYKPIDEKNDYICFAEMKLLDDIQVRSGDNPIRNQLIRVLEDAITFQRHSENKFPNRVHVTLVTPALFKTEPESRLYGYKFIDYKNNNQNNVKSILHDMNKARMGPRKDIEWNYPEKIDERIKNNLILHWVTFEEMINNIPNTQNNPNPLKEPIENLYRNIKDLLENKMNEN